MSTVTVTGTVEFVEHTEDGLPSVRQVTLDHAVGTLLVVARPLAPEVTEFRVTVFGTTPVIALMLERLMHELERQGHVRKEEPESTGPSLPVM